MPINWIEENNRLKAELVFKDFAEAMGFINELALWAEKVNHHPNWSNSWNKVILELYTHDANDTITEKDRKLVAIIDRIYLKFFRDEK